MSVGDRIKQKRKELNMSVDELAKYLGKNRATVYRYEKGEIENLPIEVLEPLAKALKTTPQYLIGWKDTLETTINVSKKDDLIMGDVIKSLRIEKHLNMEEYSEEIGIPAAVLTSYENGDRQIPASAIDKIAKFFGVGSIDIAVRLSQDESELYVNLLKNWVDTFGYAAFTRDEADALVHYGKFLLWARTTTRKERTDDNI